MHPVHPPFPITCPGDLQAREEVERLTALDEAERERDAFIEAQAARENVLPPVHGDVERVELEWDRGRYDGDDNERYHDRYRGCFR